MDRSPLYDLVKAVPFRPFTVTLSSGRHVQISGPEMILLGKRMDTVAWVDDEGYDRHVFIHHNHINSIDLYDPHQSMTPTS